VTTVNTYKVALTLGETIAAGDLVKTVDNNGVLTAYKLFNKYYPGIYIPIAPTGAALYSNYQISALGTDGLKYVIVSSNDSASPYTISVFKVNSDKTQTSIVSKNNLESPNGYQLNYIGYDSVNDKFILVSTENYY
jgi:hypothetical protein